MSASLTAQLGKAISRAYRSGTSAQGLSTPNFLLQGFIVESTMTAAAELRRRFPQAGYVVPDRESLRRVVLSCLPLQPAKSSRPWLDRLVYEASRLIDRTAGHC